MNSVLKAIGTYCFVLIYVLLLACGSQAPPSEPSTEEVSAPKEWSYYPGNEEFKKHKKVVLISGDEEYRSEEALPQLGKILSEHHGFDCTVLFAQDPDQPGLINPNYLKNIPGLDQLAEADLMIIFTRFRELPPEQMQHIDHYLMHGRPVLGIRTATHAFRFEDSTHQWRHYGNYYDGERTDWQGGFGRLVLGERWYSHHGHHKHQSTRGVVAPGATDHPVTRGVEDIWGSTDVYGVRLPLPGDAQPIILGQVINRAGEFDENDLHFGMRPSDSEIATNNPATDKSYNPNDPMMPIVWTKSYQLPEGQVGRSLTSTIGSSADMNNEGVRRLLVNACYWLLDLNVPDQADVSLVGDYQPTPYSFHREEGYWQSKELRVP